MVVPGVVLGDRYRIQSELGHGGFGRTYLACDLNRFEEFCVLKEFAPQVQEAGALQKAEELFAREAGVLYQLQHPQIPRFRELFRAHVGLQDRLFLVQDYVAGQNYRQLLTARQQQGTTFSELEVIALLRQLLPVLQYIHAIGVIHRDISPDNLIQRETDLLPVLIDFGGVKQIAASVSQMAQTPASATLLGKVGYAPPEQMQQGIVSPDSDFYALAMTVLVLRTGQEPQEMAPTWGDAFSPPLRRVLAKMLALQPGDRYPTTTAILQALDQGRNPVLPAPVPTVTPTPLPIATVAAAQPRPAPKRGFGQFLLLGIFAAAIGLTWGSRAYWLPLIADSSPPPDRPPPPEASPSPTPTSNFSPAERARKAALRDRREQLGIPAAFHVAITNTSFFDRYPDQQGRSLSDSEADAVWRERWDAIATEWLDLLEPNLSSAARRKLGSYSSADRDRWKQQINALGVSNSALNDLTDAKFFHLFPQQRGKTETNGFLQRPLGQVWQAIAADTVQSLQSGDRLGQVQFPAGAFSQQLRVSLPPGSGQVYTADLQAGQVLRLNLQAPDRTTRLSLYLPRPTADLPSLLADAADTTWSGTLPQSGLYEIVVVSTAARAIDVELTVAADNVTASPAPSLTEEDASEGNKD